MAKTFNALLIKNCQLSHVTLDATRDSSASDAIHALIGNTFTSAFHIEYKNGNNIYGFCDDEGLLTAQPQFEAVIGPMLRLDSQPIAGPIVIVGGNAEGETRSLTEDELKSFELLDVESVQLWSLVHIGKVLPLLVFDPKLAQFPVPGRDARLKVIQKALPLIQHHVQHDYLTVEMVGEMIDACGPVVARES